MGGKCPLTVSSTSLRAWAGRRPRVEQPDVQTVHSVSYAPLRASEKNLSEVRSNRAAMVCACLLAFSPSLPGWRFFSAYPRVVAGVHSWDKGGGGGQSGD